MPNPNRPRFEELTETTGSLLTPEGAEMLYTRYRFAADQANGKRVLEIACGAGQGLGLLAMAAGSVVGGDYSEPLLATGNQHYRGKIALVQLDAQNLPFAGRSFDLVLLFESTYYLPDFSRALREIRRVTTGKGQLLIVSANRERPDFISSPFSTRYHSADEFRTILLEEGYQNITVGGAFAVSTANASVRQKLLQRGFSIGRKVLEVTRLVPRTLKGRARLKRLLLGKLIRVPAEIEDGFAGLQPPSPLGPGPVAAFKVLYVTADVSS